VTKEALVRRSAWTVGAVAAAVAVAGLTAAFQARAATVEGEVLMTSRHGLTLVGRGPRAEVVRLERGGLLLGAMDVYLLKEGETVRFEPGSMKDGVRTARRLELLPTVWTTPELVADPREFVGGDEWGGHEPRPIPVDVRDRAAFALGHIEGALSAPGGSGLDAVLPREHAVPIVFYGDSHQDPRPVDALREALRIGHTNARVFRGGMREWEAATRPAFVSAADLASWLETENTLVLDVRPAEEVARGTLPRAIARKAETLSRADVAGFGLPIFVVVGRDARDPAVRAAAEAIRGAQPDGFREQAHVKILEGGIEAWRAAGRALVPPAASRDRVPCVARAGVICQDDFMRSWHQDGGVSAPLILDVRDNEGYRPAWARHIPIAQLPGRMAELPRDREIVVFCTMGFMSRIARQILDSAGFRARAVVVPEPAGP
jgi:rhodanese-related sulfurtransferase